MDDIYDLIAKHFQGETNPAEEEIILEYKDSKPEEYKVLKQLWETDGLEVIEFDSSEPWKKIKHRIHDKRFNLNKKNINIRNIAAAIAFLIISTLSIIYISNSFNFSKDILIENNAFTPKIIELLDGSKIWISSNSSISYPVEFIQRSREVVLSGKAYFEVEKDYDHPFVVQTKFAKVTVLGTSFNINSSKHLTEITVRSGEVKVESDNSDKMVVLNPKQSARVTKEKITNYEAYNINYLSWMTGIFIFNNTPVDQVISELNSFYDNRLELDSSRNYNCNLTARFEKSELDRIIKILETTCDLKSEYLNNKFILR